MYLVYVHMSATVVATTSGWIKDPFLFVRVYCCAVGNKTLAPTVRQVGNKVMCTNGASSGAEPCMVHGLCA